MATLKHTVMFCFLVNYGTNEASLDVRRSTNQQPPGNLNIDWLDKGQQDLAKTLSWRPKWKPAKNIVFFIGDGMGISTLTAARFFKAQKERIPINEAILSWENWESVGTIKTYNTDTQVGDSAATANAFISGEKTQAKTLGYNQYVAFGEKRCGSLKEKELTSLIQYAMAEGKRTGIVTTTRITHATPAAAYAHSSNRFWEADSDMPNDTDCTDIAWQLVNGPGNQDIRVLMGGGRGKFLPNNTNDVEHVHQRGERKDGTNLIQDWLKIRKNKLLLENQYKYVTNQTEFDDVDASTVDYLLGLFEPSNMNYELDRPEDIGGEPSLAEMTQKALDILKKGDKGFFLYVEGGRIDHAHHENRAQKALVDTLALEEAVQVAVENTNPEETLYVVTSDHSHQMTIGGHPDIDNDILGLASRRGIMSIGLDKKPFQTLAYTDGPGFMQHRTLNMNLSHLIPRQNLTGVIINGTDYMQDSSIPLKISTHGGEDVAVFAKGPMSHLFTGVHEQNYIAHAMGYIGCIGWNKELCSRNPRQPLECPQDVSTGAANHIGYFHIAVVVLIRAI